MLPDYLNIDTEDNPMVKLDTNKEGILWSNLNEFKSNIIDKTGHNLLRFIIIHTILKYTLEYIWDYGGYRQWDKRGKTKQLKVMLTHYRNLVIALYVLNTFYYPSC